MKISYPGYSLEIDKITLEAISKAGGIERITIFSNGWVHIRAKNDKVWALQAFRQAPPCLHYQAE